MTTRKEEGKTASRTRTTMRCMTSKTAAAAVRTPRGLAQPLPTQRPVAHKDKACLVAVFLARRAGNRRRQHHYKTSTCLFPLLPSCELGLLCSCRRLFSPTRGSVCRRTRPRLSATRSKRGKTPCSPPPVAVSLVAVSLVAVAGPAPKKSACPCGLGSATISTAGSPASASSRPCSSTKTKGTGNAAVAAVRIGVVVVVVVVAVVVVGAAALVFWAGAEEQAAVEATSRQVR
mmetsp:Transcript_54109/g.107424  ORF Transcript_54109/g.107424 Transcript_54109/m.107424 type:complete len:232 (+) Transcript_54109:116-811(+)